MDSTEPAERARRPNSCRLRVTGFGARLRQQETRMPLHHFPEVPLLQNGLQLIELCRSNRSETSHALVMNCRAQPMQCRNLGADLGDRRPHSTLKLQMLVN